MAVIEVAKVKPQQVDKRSLYATVCYYYPQYKLSEVEALAHRDVNLLAKHCKKNES